MRLSVLSVSYPLAAVSPDSVGGAEQVLSMLDACLVAAGHSSFVIAPHGSKISGRLMPLPSWDGELTPQVHAEAIDRVRGAIAAALARHRIDIVHLHGLDFLSYLPDTDVSVVATLHLPPSWYPAEIFQLRRDNTILCCVSQTQLCACPANSPVRYLPNGIALPRFSYAVRKKSYAVMLSRICREKGVHLALLATRRAGVPLFVAGQVFEYTDHRRYFESEVVPLLDDCRRFLGPAKSRAKRRLLANARCLLVPSLVDETSSLVTMEALASGTPVIAFRRGALPELIEHGRTGFLVENEIEMAEAIRCIDTIKPEQCREYAVRHFSGERCFERYLALYHELAANTNS